MKSLKIILFLTICLGIGMMFAQPSTAVVAFLAVTDTPTAPPAPTNTATSPPASTNTPTPPPASTNTPTAVPPGSTSTPTSPPSGVQTPNPANTPVGGGGGGDDGGSQPGTAVPTPNAIPNLGGGPTPQEMFLLGSGLLLGLALLIGGWLKVWQAYQNEQSS